MTSILVVIPTLDEASNIERVIEELYCPSANDLQTLFVVVDGGSSDGTVAKVRELQASYDRLELLHNPERIQSAGINRAVEAFGESRDVLVRCDAHASYPRDFVSDLAASLRRHNCDSVVVPLDSIGVGCRQKAIAWVADMPLGSGGAAHRGGRSSGFVDHGHHAAFRLDRFRELGGYNGAFSHNEDAEYDCRNRRAGGRIFLDAAIRVRYWPRASFAALWRQYRAYGGGRCRTVMLHPQSLKLRQLAVPANLAAIVASLLLAPLVPALLLLPAVYLAALAYASLIVATSRSSLCGLLAGPAALTMHTAWAIGFYGGLAARLAGRGGWRRHRPLAGFGRG